MKKNLENVLTLTIRVIISDVEIPSVLCVAQNMSLLFGNAYESEQNLYLTVKV